MMSLHVEAPSGDKNTIIGKGYHFALALQKIKRFQHFIQELLQFEKSSRF